MSYNQTNGNESLPSAEQEVGMILYYNDYCVTTAKCILCYLPYRRRRGHYPEPDTRLM